MKNKLLYSLWIPLFLLASVPGCSSIYLDFTPKKNIVIELTGNDCQVEYACCIKSRQPFDTTAFDMKKNQEAFINPPLSDGPKELKALDHNRNIRPLPLKETYSLSSDEGLYLFVKPYNARKDIRLKIEVDGKRKNDRLIHPDNLGIYLSY